MNFFSKQISTIFLSLSFFLISSEGWAADVPVEISGCDLSTSTGICSIVACADANTYIFKVSGVEISRAVVDTSSPTPPDVDTAGCRALCLNACINYRESREFAVASTSVNTFSKSICNAFRIVTGSAGKTFAAFAIIATGIGFFSGKVSWGLMIGVAAGIATMFGAPSIVAAISGTTVNTQCTLATGMSGS
jgi:type IV secretory pathway VirB2 component (pilin)